MAKRKKPYPPFIVHVPSGKFYMKTVPSHFSFQERLKYVVYEYGKQITSFNKNATLEQQVNPKSFRRPTRTELLLFDKEA